MANTDQPELRTRTEGQEVVGVGRESLQDPLPTARFALNAGAPPSNTAPVNSNTSSSATRLLRSGVDSLYVSYPGSLPPQKAEALESLKVQAKSLIPLERSSAIIEINDHRFEVRDRGKGRFPYVLVDNWYHIQVSSDKSAQMPLAYVQLRSELLTAHGWCSPLDDLTNVVNKLGGGAGDPGISRVDLCVDFTTEVDMGAIPLDAWVARPKDSGSYFSTGRFTGHAFGLGGDLSARLYDKTVEIRKSRKDFLIPLWQACGWDGQTTVWRLEFQFRRPVLRELGVESADTLAYNTSALWRYATQEWLRLTQPNDNDATRSRWPNHPLWTDLGNATWDSGDGDCLRRVSKRRTPDDHYLFKNGISGITSYMAREGITDFYDGLTGFIRDAVDYHRIQGFDARETLQSYARTKTLDKARRYNTLINPARDPDGGTEVGG